MLLKVRARFPFSHAVSSTALVAVAAGGGVATLSPAAEASLPGKNGSFAVVSSYQDREESVQRI